MDFKKYKYENTQQSTLFSQIQGLFYWLRFLRRKWHILAIAVIIGTLLGFSYTKIKTTRYQAISNFALFESEGGGGGVLGSEALAMLGYNGGKGISLFNSMKNIVWLYKSRAMINQTLLSHVQRNGKQTLLLNWFIEESGLDKTFAKDPQLKNLKFSLEDSVNNISIAKQGILNTCYSRIVSSYLKVEEATNTENIISVKFSSKDEIFSKLFNENLVTLVNDYYIKTKTKKTVTELDNLIAKSDSLRSSISHTMVKIANNTDNVPYLNPNKTILTVSRQDGTVDQTVLVAAYKNVVVNLEAKKLELSQEKPLIQIIDSPTLPLDTGKPSLINAIFIGVFICSLITSIVLIATHWYQKEKTISEAR